ncbi:MAG: hypothetical protein GC129_02890 [Proteobacteria bacterium]|nr:hypothetical protein [Pseudomonadota bacterium]
MADLPTPPTHQKYTFDTEFFEVVGDAKSPSPTATRAPASMPANPRQKAYDEGYTTGLKEGQQQAQADLAQLQQHLQSTLTALQKTTEERESTLATQMLALLRTTLYRQVGDLMSHYPDELLEQHLRSVLPLIKADESLTLRIHPAARGYHEKLQLPQASILGLPMHIITDPSLGLTDAVVEWKNGGVESKVAQHFKALDQLLAAAGAALLPTPPMPTEATPAAKPATPAAATGAAATPPPAATGSAVEQATQASQSRAAELLGDEELVDALKPK